MMKLKLFMEKTIMCFNQFTTFLQDSVPVRFLVHLTTLFIYLGLRHVTSNEL